MNDIEVYFGEYKTLAGDKKRLADADKALKFLEVQFQETNPDALRDFDKMWLNGDPALTPELLFVNVAKFYKPKEYPHQFEALKFLNGYLSQGTREEFDRLWFGRPLKP